MDLWQILLILFWAIQRGIQWGMIKCAISAKHLAVKQNGPNIGPLGYVFSVYRVLLTVLDQVQFGVIRYISEFHRPCTCCISEMTNRRAKQTKIWASDPAYHCRVTAAPVPAVMEATKSLLMVCRLADGLSKC